MFHQGIEEIPQKVIENAVSNYRFSRQIPIEEKLAIEQKRYAEEHGSFAVETSVENNILSCTLIVGSEEHTCQIPLLRENLELEIYPVGSFMYDTLELVAVSLSSDFPWTSEAFVATYYGRPDPETIETEEDETSTEFWENQCIHQQYFVPRTTSSDSPDCAVLPGDSQSDEFQTIPLYIFTKNTPNPWVYGATLVVYEDEELGSMLLSDEHTKLDSEKYRLTPPEEVNTFMED